MVSVNFRISEDLLKAVDELLKGKDKTRSSFINEAIEAYYRKWLREEVEGELGELYPEDREISHEEKDWMDADLSSPVE